MSDDVWVTISDYSPSLAKYISTPTFYSTPGGVSYEHSFEPIRIRFNITAYVRDEIAKSKT